MNGKRHATLSQQCILLTLLTTLIYLFLTFEHIPTPHWTHQAVTPFPPTSVTARFKSPLPSCALRSDPRPAKSFLVIFMGHSGSTAIITELKSHSQIFRYDGMEPVDHQEHPNTTAALQYTRAFFKAGISAGMTPGFKMRPSHILNRPHEWRALVDEFDTRIIWQYRKNLFKASVGEYTTRYLNDSSAVSGLMPHVSWKERCRRRAGCSFRIENFDFFHSLLLKKVVSHRQISEAVETVAGGANCVLDMPYEDYLYGRKEAMRRLQKFLGLNAELTVPKRSKATGDNLCRVVKNWNQLCALYYSCPLWQPFLDDERNNCFCPFAKGGTKYCNTP